jgi:hypothetical protein
LVSSDTETCSADIFSLCGFDGGQCLDYAIYVTPCSFVYRH